MAEWGAPGYARPIYYPRNPRGGSDARRGGRGGVFQGQDRRGPPLKLIKPDPKPQYGFYCTKFNLGVWMGEKTIEIKKRVQVLTNPKIVFSAGIRKCTLTFTIDENQYKVTFGFKDISHEITVAPGANGIYIFFTLRRPPLLLYKASEWAHSENDDEVEEAWRRATDQSNEGTIWEFGRYLTYVLSVTDKQVESQDVMKKLAELQPYDIIAHQSIVDDSISIDTYVSSGRRIRESALKTLPNRILFQMTCLFSWGIVAREYITQDFMEYIKTQPEDLICEGLRIMWTPDPAVVYFDPLAKLKEVVAVLESSASDLKEEENIVHIRRITVTPTKAYFYGPVPEISNRVLRQYKHLSDRFLRVTFADESLERLGGFHTHHHDDVIEKVEGVLTNGFEIGDYKYTFLAVSSSQLRENSYWAFAETEDVTAESLYAFMGDFSQIDIVGKYTARMGQCFSTTYSTGLVVPEEVQMTQDITKEDSRNGKIYCFSDGIGMISAEFAAQIAERLKFKNVPSAFQIRYGGCKGVVAVCQGIPPSVKLVFRPSMKKFECDYYDLEIITVSRPIVGFLNRQIIYLLSGLGIPDEVFEKKQDAMVEDLNNMLTDSNRAIELLHAFTASYYIVRKGLEAGFSVTEPLFNSMLQVLRVQKLRDLKQKTKLMITQSRQLLGVMDETNTLQYGQIFVRYNKEIHSRDEPTPAVLTGPVVVTKNPCLHPGDCRRLTAVDVPALHHHLDVVVFPRNGPRPHTDECSGSDLDGDLYFITWDPGLIFEKNFPPMDYLGQKPTFIKGGITMDQVVHADKCPAGVFSQQCLALARLHSVAVDFNKTSVPAELPKELRPSIYPDFMGKKDKIVYESTRVIGRMFRKVQHLSKKLALDVYEHVEPDPDVIAQADLPTYLASARIHRVDYSNRLWSIMRRYGVRNESEIITSTLLRLHWHLRKKSNYWSAKQGISDSLGLLNRHYHLQFWEEFFPDIKPTDEQFQPDVLKKIFAKACTWYYATYHPSEQPPPVKFLSFPWLNTDLLCAVKSKQTQLSIAKTIPAAVLVQLRKPASLAASSTSISASTGETLLSAEGFLDEQLY